MLPCPCLDLQNDADILMIFYAMSHTRSLLTTLYVLESVWVHSVALRVWDSFSYTTLAHVKGRQSLAS